MPGVTNDKLYELVNQTRVELNGNIQRVEMKVDGVVNGPLSDMNKRVTNLEIKDATLSTKVYVLVFIISSAVSGIMTAVALKFIK